MINIADILKDYPKGTKLYSPIFGDVYLESVRPHISVVVTLVKGEKDLTEFLYDGRYGMNGECMLFPSKENRDWNTFQKQFKDGDIISSDAYIAIFHKFGKPQFCEYDKVIYYHCWCYQNGKDFKFEDDFGIGRDTEYRFATDEEKQKLFDVIKENGYKWNAETKTLDKLIVPKFKIGDQIVKKNSIQNSYIVNSVSSDYYGLKLPIGTGVGVLSVDEQDDWELAHNKFDISTLKAYDKVLVRDDDNSAWINTFFGFCDTVTDIVTNKKYPFIAGSVNWAQCIPYEGNEHLLGTNNDCDEYFKNW